MEENVFRVAFGFLKLESPGPLTPLSRAPVLAPRGCSCLQLGQPALCIGFSPGRAARRMGDSLSLPQNIQLSSYTLHSILPFLAPESSQFPSPSAMEEEASLSGNWSFSLFVSLSFPNPSQYYMERSFFCPETQCESCQDQNGLTCMNLNNKVQMKLRGDEGRILPCVRPGI